MSQLYQSVQYTYTVQCIGLGTRNWNELYQDLCFVEFSNCTLKQCKRCKMYNSVVFFTEKLPSITTVSWVAVVLGCKILEGGIICT